MSLREDDLDAVRYAFWDFRRYRAGEMSAEDASDSIRKLLTRLLATEPTDNEVSEILES